MAVAFSVERAEDPDTTNQTAYTVGAAFTPAANTLLILVNASVDQTDGTYTISTVAGGSLTWNSIRAALAQTSTDFYRLESFTALVGGSPVSTTVVVTHSESVTGHIGWVGEFTGHNTTTPIKASAVGTWTTDPSLSLAAAPDSDSLVLMTGQLRRNPPAWTEEAGWTEHMDIGHGTPPNGAAVWSKANDQSFTATGVDLAGGGQIFEIDAAAAGGATEDEFYIGAGYYGHNAYNYRRGKRERWERWRPGPTLLRSWTSVDGVLVAAWVHPLRDEILGARDGLYVPVLREVA